MNKELIKLMTTILGSKRIAEGAVAYLSMCRAVPSEEDVRKALRVNPLIARKIVAAVKLTGEFLLDTVPVSVRNPALVAAYLSDLKFAKTEHFVVLTVAADNTLIRRHECSSGSPVRTIVDSGTVLHSAIEDQARSIIVVHNHPSGSTEFSSNDYDFTKQLVKAGIILSIQVLDSIVITHRGLHSMRAERPEMFDVESIQKNLAAEIM